MSIVNKNNTLRNSQLNTWSKLFVDNWVLQRLILKIAGEDGFVENTTH